MINKATINKMLEMPDDRLVSMLRILLSAAGIDMGGRTLDEKTVRKLRGVLTEVTDADIERVLYLMDKYNRGG